MTQPDPTNPLPVEQVDREAVAQFVESVRGEGWLKGHHNAYRAGAVDASALIQAFARHRLATQASSTLPRADVVEALRECVTKLEEERDELLHSFCTVRDGVPMRDTMSLDDAPFVEEFDEIIGRAHAALSSHPAAEVE